MAKSPVFATRGPGPGGWIWVVAGRLRGGPAEISARLLADRFFLGRSMAWLARRYGVPVRVVEQVIREALNGARWWKR